MIERAVILSKGVQLRLDIALADMPTAAPATPALDSDMHEVILTDRECRDRERANLMNALKRADGPIYGQGGAAELLQIMQRLSPHVCARSRSRRTNGHADPLAGGRRAPSPTPVAPRDPTVGFLDVMTTRCGLFDLDRNAHACIRRDTGCHCTGALITLCSSRGLDAHRGAPDVNSTTCATDAARRGHP